MRLEKARWRVRHPMASLLLFATSACGDDAATTLDAAMQPDASSDGGTEDVSSPDARVAASTVRVDGDYLGFFSDDPAEGGEVCALGPDEPICGTANALGHWILEGVPARSERELRYSADGFVTNYRYLRTGEIDVALYGFAFATDDILAAVAMELDATPEPRLGHAVFEATMATITSVSHNDVAGVSVRMRSALTGGDVRQDAIYVNDMQVPQRTLTATTSSGWGFFMNVQPGEYLVTFTHPTRTCVAHPEIGWPAPDGTNATVRIYVHAGSISTANAFCPPD